jgi:hypothetical protein
MFPKEFKHNRKLKTDWALWKSDWKELCPEPERLSYKKGRVLCIFSKNTGRYTFHLRKKKF